MSPPPAPPPLRRLTLLDLLELAGAAPDSSEGWEWERLPEPPAHPCA